MEAKDEILPSPVMLVRSQANKSAAETSPDEKLVADALEKIENLCNGDYHAAMQQAGIENGRHETNEEKMQIIPVKRLEAEIAACKDFCKLKEIKDKAEALRIFFRRAKIGFELANRYSELKIRAERRCGEILGSEIKHGGDRKSKSRFNHRTLKDLGINKNQSRCWQTVAEFPEALFEEHLTKVKDGKKELTSACVYRRAFEFRRAKEADSKPIPGADSVKTPIRIPTGTGDFMDYIDQYKDVDAIITDPPYGKEHLDLFEKLARFAAQVLKPGGSLLTMAGVYHLPKVMELMTPHLTYYWTIAYHMPAKRVQIQGKKVWCNWKPILWFVKGKYEGHRVKDFLIAAPREKGLHPWQQSEEDFGALIEMFTKPGDMIIDPFYGSGTLGAAAIMRNRRFFGVEIDPKTMETAEKRLERLSKKIVLPSYFPGKNPAEILDNWEKQGNNGGDPNEVEANPTDRPDEQKVVQAESFEENGKEYIPTDRIGVYNVILKGRKPDEPKNVALSDIGGDGEELPN
jgi:16S rRNA G966 N2-methylase RsmD